MDLSSPDDSNGKTLSNLEEDPSSLGLEKHMVARNDVEGQDNHDALGFVYEDHIPENGASSLLPDEANDKNSHSLVFNSTQVAETDILNKVECELPDSYACNGRRKDTGYENVRTQPYDQDTIQKFNELDNKLPDTHSEKAELLSDEIETGNIHHEPVKEDSYAPRVALSVRRDHELDGNDLHSLSGSPCGSPIMDRNLSDPSGGAPCIQESDGKDETSRPKRSSANLKDSPKSFSHEVSLSPERAKKRAPSQEHLSSPYKRDSPSGTTWRSHSIDDFSRKSPLPSPRRRDSSTRRRDSSTRRRDSPTRRRDSPTRRRDSPTRRRDSPRRTDRTASRSPVRRRDSSEHRRSHRDRSRSRSPRARDRHHRISPRRGHSPRRRPSPSYRSGRPPKKPWLPPPNRTNGIGTPGRTLFVAGFNFMISEADLESKFSRFGRIRGVRIVKDRRSGDSRGFGFVSFDKDEEADEAIRAMDQSEWRGRIVLVEKSKPLT